MHVPKSLTRKAIIRNMELNSVNQRGKVHKYILSQEYEAKAYYQQQNFTPNRCETLHSRDL